MTDINRCSNFPLLLRRAACTNPLKRALGYKQVSQVHKMCIVSIQGSILMINSPFTGNGSSSKASQLALVFTILVAYAVLPANSMAAALYSVGGVRTTFTIGVGAGGPAAYWLVVIMLLNQAVRC